MISYFAIESLNEKIERISSCVCKWYGSAVSQYSATEIPLVFSSNVTVNGNKVTIKKAGTYGMVVKVKTNTNIYGATSAIYKNNSRIVLAQSESPSSYVSNYTEVSLSVGDVVYASSLTTGYNFLGDSTALLFLIN